MSLTRRFVAQSLAISARHDPALLDKLKLCLADHVGCVLAGAAMPWARQTLAALSPWPVGNGSPVLGQGFVLAPAEAAFANAVLASSSSRTDTHPPTNSHPGAVLFPVLLALAAQRGSSGADLLDAALAGYQAMGRLGRIMVDDDFRKRFRTTPVIGSVGGAIAAAHLLKLDTDRAIQAVALAANAAGGLMQWAHSGGLDLIYHAAQAARAVVHAALLAEAGCTASEAILEGEGGLLMAFGGRERVEELLSRREPTWEIEAIDFKPVPACVFVQASAYAALKLVTENTVDAARIRAVSVTSFHTALRFPGCDNPGPLADIQAARMSLQHSVAAVLVRGTLADANYLAIDDTAIQRLCGVMTLHEDAAMTAAFPARQSARVDITLDDGRRIGASVDDIPVFGPAQVLARADAVAAATLGAAQAARLMQACGTIEACADMRDFLKPLSQERRAA
ncbi:MmgE/PrpD family protein [Ferrovibrio sp.]|uniref:MmgE/PrpD family protein n=1 Tax=Ferrovibrio sp. TaxID=1917215 RepID=UPI003D145A3D